MRDAYTRYPRPILWLIAGGTVTPSGGLEGGPSFDVESFYLSKFPVSNEHFEAFDPGYQRSPTSPGDRDPAVGVSWYEARDYCAWYARVSRKPMRLPSEIEWEHACRGGCEGSTYVEDPDQLDHFLWHAGNSGDRLPPLDAKKANPNGLWGMLGGVWEWTSSADRQAAAEAAPLGEERRILRGGSYRLPAEELTFSLRRAEDPATRFDDVGFRVAKSLR